MRRAGFTLVEVMVAMAVITVGAGTFMMLHQVSGRAVASGRDQSMAVAFQETWVERIRRDGLRWIQGSGLNGLDQTVYLGQANHGAWFVPTTPNPTIESHGADRYGFETDVAADMRFCVNLLVEPTFPTAAGAQLEAVRVLLRVWWHRDGADQTDPDIRGGRGCLGMPGDMRTVNKTVTFTMVRPQ
jgi:type IV pilus assembly protein PilV